MVSSNNIKMKILFKGKKNYDRSKRFLLMSAEEVALSTEETDHLVRSTKKQKATSKPFSPQIPILSYKDSILCPSSDWEDLSAQNLPFDDEDTHSDIELDNDNPFPTILLSQEEEH